MGSEVQSTWFDFGATHEVEEPEETEESEEPGEGRGSDEFSLQPDWESSGFFPNDPLSCPWCLAPPEMFHNVPNGVGCTRCEALIPTESEWYQRGEKIASPAGAYNMWKYRPGATR
jgi:hypothetical protein